MSCALEQAEQARHGPDPLVLRDTLCSAAPDDADPSSLQAEAAALKTSGLEAALPGEDIQGPRTQWNSEAVETANKMAWDQQMRQDGNDKHADVDGAKKTDSSEIMAEIESEFLVHPLPASTPIMSPHRRYADDIAMSPLIEEELSLGSPLVSSCHGNCSTLYTTAESNPGGLEIAEV